MTGRPLDQAAREEALNPRDSFHLEAPAGSGKTSVLLARFLTLLARVDAPEALLALTFTRKAAGELRARVMDLLWRRRDPDPGASPWEHLLQELADQVLRHYDRKGALPELLAPERLPVMTFHSFCAQLLRYAPLEAGVPLEFRLLEEDEARWLKQEALEELRRRLSARSPGDPARQALIRRLARLNNNWPRVAGELGDLLARRDCLAEFLPLARNTRDPGRYEDLLTDRYRVLLTPLLAELARGLAGEELGGSWPDFWQTLQGSGHGAQLPERLPGPEPRDLPQWQAIAAVLLTKDGDLRKSFTARLGFPENFKNTPWPNLITRLPKGLAQGLKQCRRLTAAAARPEEAAALQDLVILLGEAIQVYEESCYQRQALDFIALERAALRLLEGGDPGDLLLRLDRRLTHLLVDEFQDTSEAQMALLCRLLEGWEGGAGRTLMVVGDPKQSIYGWRQAKVRLFQESRRGLPCREAGTFPLKELLLTTNFRSSATLIHWANGVFGPTVMAGATQEGVEFHAATPRPDAGAGAPPELALFIVDDHHHGRDAEARWLAREVALAAPELPPGEKIGVLLFARTHLRAYLQAFNDAGLAVQVKEGLRLADSRVAQHLHNLARALTRPQDDASWAGVLRGPWTQVSLALLARMAQTPGDLWPEKLKRFLEEGSCPPEPQEIIPGLLAAREQVGRRPLAEVLHGFLEAAGAWPGLAALEGPLGVANGRAYLDLLIAAESGLPEATFSRAGFNLELAFQPPDPRALDARVELLTVHGAKGLEFHQVFIPFLDWQPLKNESKSPPFLLEELPGTRLHGLALARAYHQEKQSSLYVLLHNLKANRVLEEARRVFYVAVTRARRRLVLSGVVKGRNGELSPPDDSPLGWLWQHYTPPGFPAGGAVTWPQPEIRVRLLTAVPAGAPLVQEAPELPPPLEFHPEPLPYHLEFPSQLAERPVGAREEEYPPDAGSASGVDGDDTLRVRGEVTHRLLETWSREGFFPPGVAVAAALRQGGLDREAAARLAPEILAEAAACVQEPFLAGLLRAATPPAREWLLEAAAGPGLIRRGIIDLMAFDGKFWWLLDYKTSRPAREEDWEDFLVRETEQYRPQLLAYREMACKAKGVKPGDLRLGLYFTAGRRLVEL